MTGAGEDEGAGLRAEVRRRLEGRLELRQPGRSSGFMGAGSDDLVTGRAWLATLDEVGLAVPTWPVEHGGMEATTEEAAVVASELSRFAAPDLYPFGVGLTLVGPVLLTHGDDGQRRRWLGPIRTGEEIWCQLFSEPDAGSDLAGLTTRAERDGDTWRLSGSKVWSSRAHYARWGLLLARSDPTVPKHAGITAFALDMAAPGVEVRPLRQMNGDTHFNQVFLQDTPVPDGDRIGGVGEGWGVATTTLMHERAGIGSAGGGAHSANERLVALSRARGLAVDPVVRQRLASVRMSAEVARLTALRARAAARSGRPPGPEGSGAKLRFSEDVKARADLALDLEGPHGVAGEGDPEWLTLFLTGPSLSIRGGTDEIQRNIVGERVLGLPREPRP
ncbi:MAG: acyl-CoA dehydrogenase family protein [Actinomycetota bacterium]|nr:acyl-CoA dehydrogenase family protein [Actinomycetota bacterium]